MSGVLARRDGRIQPNHYPRSTRSDTALAVGGVAWIVGTLVYFIAQPLVASAWTPGYSWLHNYISDLDVRPGVSSDEGDGDDWPAVRQQILDADIFVMGTPIWMGHPSSHAQRVLERLDAFLGETSDDGRMVSLDRVAIVAVVGNEDGAHHVAAELFQGLNDVGFTIPAAGMTYWVGEAMHKTDYKDLPSGSDKTHQATKTAAANAAHLAALLNSSPYPA